MKDISEETENLLLRYFSGDYLNQEEEEEIQNIQNSPEYEDLFREMQMSWNAMQTLRKMQTFNSFDALKRISPHLKEPFFSNWPNTFRKIAAILILPLVVYALYTTWLNHTYRHITQNVPVVEKVTASEGSITTFTLPDGSQVWLNEGSSLEFPLLFKGDRRDVSLNGEAYFEVAENRDMPFYVNFDGLTLEVTGTSFNVAGYDSLSEIVLTEGKVSLYDNNNSGKNKVADLSPGQMALYDHKTGNSRLMETETDKYTAWTKGKLILREDSMNYVIRRLSNWFNADFIIQDPALYEYVITATFSGETLDQVLYFLTLSSPIRYEIINQKVLPNGELEKQKIILRQNNPS
jgi:ferric-dicitrate binding protein FerR (iron transport regulator)